MVNPGSVPSPEAVAVWVGLDWADQRHQIALYEVGSGQSESSSLEASAEALQVWLAQLRQRFGGARVAIILEQARGAVISALLSCEFVILYPVNPQSLAKYRQVYYPSGAKSDPNDAELLQQMVRQNPQRFRAWKPDNVETRSLQLLVEGRRQLVDQKTALTQQLNSRLKSYYPQALELAGELGSQPACEFLKRWPTLSDLQKTRPSQIRQFYSERGRPSRQQLEQRLERIRQAQPLTQDPALLRSGALMVQALVDQIIPLLAAIERFDQEIAALFQQHPDRPLFDILPGAGPALAPRLLVAFGTDRERWQGAGEVQQLSGIAPVTEQSGNHRWVHWRWACPKFLRQTFQEFADRSRHWSDWARAFYQGQRARGKKHHAALRALAFKWIRILFHCWKTRTPYNEPIYLKALEKRNSPLVAALRALPPRGPRKKVA
jgi:transposase